LRYKGTIIEQLLLFKHNFLYTRGLYINPNLYLFEYLHFLHKVLL